MACAAVLALAGRAQWPTIVLDGIEYTVYADRQTADVTGYEGSPVDVVVPATVEYEGADYAVTTIQYGCFFTCESLRSIVVPEGVTRIGGSAFQRCPALERVTLPSTVLY